MIKHSILEVIGKTPLIKLDKLSKKYNFTIYAKYELSNAGGSIKDRAALNIIQSAISNNEINKDTTIIESSSGNMAIALSMICNAMKLKFIAVVDIKTTEMNINIMKSYGAEVIIIDTIDPETKTYLSARLRKIQELLASNKNYFWANQYNNKDNIDSHKITMREIYSDLNSNLDYMFVATSTCGTITGCGEFLINKKVKLIAVDAYGSVIFNKSPSSRLIPGHGAGIIPKNLNKKFIDDVIHITDKECVNGCLNLLEEESIFAGGSSGAVLAAIEKYKENIKENSNVVVILADRGDRYMDTIFNKQWRDMNLEEKIVQEVVA